MTEERQKSIDLILKIVGFLGLTVSGIWTYYKFRQDRKVDITTSQNALRSAESARLQELNSFVFQKQMELYLEVSQAAAVIASSKDVGKRSAATARFRELYYGDLVIVEDRRVELAMIEFSDCLDSGQRVCERLVTTTEDNKKIPNDLLFRLGLPTLPELSLELSACIRTALEDDRKIQFGNSSDAKTSCPYD